VNIFSLAKKAFTFTKSAVKELIFNKRDDKPGYTEHSKRQEPTEEPQDCIQKEEKSSALQKLKKNRGNKSKVFERNR